MKSMNPVFTSLAALAIWASLDSEAQQAEGYINNDNGDECRYTQVVEEQVKYFHETLVGNVYKLTFDNPDCMSDSGVGLEVNQMMINNIIINGYSQPDASFQTRVSELYPRTVFALLTRGKCIQSAKYPAVGVTVDYIVENNSIVAVAHGMAAGGCKK